MSPRPATAVDALADSYLRAYAQLQPIEATQMGLPGYDHQMTDFSPDGWQAVADLDRATLARLDELEPVDGTDADTVAALRDRLGVALELHEAGTQFADLNILASPLQSLRDVFDVMPSASRDDWATIAARLKALPDAMDGYLASLREGIARGIMPAVRQVEIGVEQAQELAGPDSFFTVFVDKAAGVPEPLARDLRVAALAARHAYERLVRFLSDELAPNAPSEDACGRERYALWSRFFVGAAVNLDETYEWGLDELAAVTAEQEEVARQIAGTSAGVAEAIATLSRDPSRTLHGTQALKAWMQQTADAAIEALDGTQFDIPAPIRRLECLIAPTQHGGIYYTGPSDDLSRPGRMWWSVPAGVTEFTTWREKTTIYHEGVPGHHLQIAQAVLNRAELNTWRRLGCWTSGHGEGWALYAERLMEEFGFLDDPGDRLGMLDAERLRAVRVVFDLGVHLRKPAPERWGGGRWDADKGWNLLRANVHTDEAFARFEWNRYLGWPGQAPSYKIGQRLWRQLRDEATARGVGVRDFHSRALRLGSLPLDVLRHALTR